MSFLFGKKSKEGKGQTAPAQRIQEGQIAPASGPSIPTLNGSRPKERGAGIQSPTPGANIPPNSIDTGNTPSPEHGQGQRGRQDSDLSVCHDSFVISVWASFPVSYMALAVGMRCCSDGGINANFFAMVARSTICP